MERINYSSGAEWEAKVGYSRAVKIGQSIEVSGTVAVENGVIIGKGNPYIQTKKILEIIIDAVEALGGTVENIIRTRIYVTNANDWQEVGRAHGEIFREILPATSLVEVSALINPDYLVEIEATAIV